MSLYLVWVAGQEKRGSPRSDHQPTGEQFRHPSDEEEAIQRFAPYHKSSSNAPEK